MALGSLVIAVAVVSASATLDPLLVDPASGTFIAADGRTVVLRGLNAVFKEPPYIPIQDRFDSKLSLSDEDYANLRKWGFNVLRIGVMLEAVLPDALHGAINETWLQESRQLVDRMEEHGVYALLDAHQDDFNRQFCGEGFPRQMAANRTDLGPLAFPWPLPFNVSIDGQGNPNLTQCLQEEFILWSFSAAVQASWGGLYNKSSVAHSLFARHWGAVARHFNGSNGVAGYELLNEPLPGDAFRDPLLYVEEGKADLENLLPLYQAAHAAIRSQDRDHVVLYEPSVLEPQILQSTGFPNGGVAGPGLEEDRQAFAFHMYCANQNASGDITNVPECEDYIDLVWGTTNASLDRVGSRAAFLTEFGAVGPHESSAEAIGHVLDLADTRLLSAAYWSYKEYHDITTQNPATETLYNDDGSLQELKLRALSRTYAPFIAAKPGTARMSFNSSDPTSPFVLSYTTDAGLRNTSTEVFLNAELRYAGGVKYSLEPPTAGTVVYPAGGDTHRLRVDHGASMAHSSGEGDGIAVVLKVWEGQGLGNNR